MAIQIRNPEAPATRKQLWLLHILTKEDTRGWNLTMQQASDKIEELKNGNSRKPDAKHSTAKRHWGIDTFVQTGRSSISGIPEGYCSKCFGDMYILSGNRLMHYDSHKRAKALGLWGKQASRPQPIATKSTPLFTTPDAEAITERRQGKVNHKSVRYYLFTIFKPSSHRMSNGKYKVICWNHSTEYKTVKAHLEDWRGNRKYVFNTDICAEVFVKSEWPASVIKSRFKQGNFSDSEHIKVLEYIPINQSIS